MLLSDWFCCVQASMRGSDMFFVVLLGVRDSNTVFHKVDYFLAADVRRCKSVSAQVEYYPISSDGAKVAVWRQEARLIFGNAIYHGSYRSVCDSKDFFTVTIEILIP
jgi:hypothetical protein